MGIHCGEAARTTVGLVGLEVHRAGRGRLRGQVPVSEAAAVLVRDGLPTGAALRDLDVHRLKDLVGAGCGGERNSPPGSYYVERSRAGLRPRTSPGSWAASISRSMRMGRSRTRMPVAW